MQEEIFRFSTVKGNVNAGNRGLRGILIEAFDVPANFQNCLPLCGFPSLIAYGI